jgi:hypothetical protein
MKPKKNSYVVVTTEFRGVFFGKVKSSADLPEEITLTGAKNCIYWSQDMEGFLGLASKGPSPDCRIGALVDELTLYKVTSWAKCSQEAVAKWK